MTTFDQFCARAKMRHDFSDQIQVRYSHPNGEAYDTWVSGEEVLQRLKTASREQLIRSFSAKNWEQAKSAIQKEFEQGKGKARQYVKGRLGDSVEDILGGNLFGDTLADNIRGVDSTADPHDETKKQWQTHLQDTAFRAVVLQLAWINLDGSLPAEAAAEPDDWT